MVKSSMLAAALYLSAGADLDRKFNRTTVYLDTPILIKVLGYDGEESQAAALDVVRLARARALFSRASPYAGASAARRVDPRAQTREIGRTVRRL